MSCASCRQPYERRARLRRAIQLRRRKQAKRLGIVVASLSVMAVSITTAWVLVEASAQRGEQLEPLMAVADQPAIDPVAMTIKAPPPPPEVAAPQAAPTVKVVATRAIQSDEVRYFNGRAVKPVKVMRMVVTAYSPDEKSCGRFADGKTAAGYSVFTNGGKLVAADTRLLPFGSLLTIPGYDDGKIVPVLDVGGKIKGHRLDVLYPTHRIARKWGVQTLDVTVWDYVD